MNHMIPQHDADEAARTANGMEADAKVFAPTGRQLDSIRTLLRTVLAESERECRCRKLPALPKAKCLRCRIVAVLKD